MTVLSLEIRGVKWYVKETWVELEMMSEEADTSVSVCHNDINCFSYSCTMLTKKFMLHAIHKYCAQLHPSL